MPNAGYCKLKNSRVPRKGLLYYSMKISPFIYTRHINALLQVSYN